MAFATNLQGNCAVIYQRGSHQCRCASPHALCVRTTTTTTTTTTTSSSYMHLPHADKARPLYCIVSMQMYTFSVEHVCCLTVFVRLFQMTTTYTYQSERMYIPVGFTGSTEKNDDHHYHYMSFIPMTVAVSLIVLITIPLLDLVVYPCIGAYAPSIIIKVGIGLVFAFLSSGTALVVEGLRYTNVHTREGHIPDVKNVFQPLHGVKSASYDASAYPVLNLLPQFIFLGVAECFLNIGGECVCLHGFWFET